jgi:HEAT repeat protein
MRVVSIMVVLCLSHGPSAFLAGAAEGKNQSPPAEARSVEQLLQLIQDRQRTWEERRDCAEALARHPDYDSTPILSLLKSQDAHVRMLGAIALRGGADKAVPELLRILQEDPNGTVQSFAAVSLGRIGDRRAVPVLLRLADDENTHYRALWEIV